MHKALAYLLTALLFISCGKEEKNASDRSVFRMNLAAGLNTLDPAFARAQSSIWMCAQLYNGLVTFDADLNIKPGLAYKWEIEDSGLTYRFHLRNDVFFHNNPALNQRDSRKVSAKDFKYSFTRICDPVLASNGFWIFNGKVRGISDFREGKSEEIAGFEAPDDSTFIIHLEKPLPPFLGMLAMAYASVVPKEAVDAFGKDFRSHPVGTGPFKMKSWKEGRSLILLKNEDYFEKDASGNALPYLDAVQVRFIRSRLSEFVEFCQGNLDLVNSVDKSFKDEIFTPEGKLNPKYTGKYDFQLKPQLNTEFIGILVDKDNPLMQDHPLADVRVRQALNYAIDRKKLVDYLLNGNGYPAHAGISPKGIPGFSQELTPGYSYNPDKAARLLTEAGYPGGKGIPLISLKSNPSYKAVMEYVQKSLERIGVTVELDELDGSTLREKAAKGQIRMWRASWIADYPDMENYLGLFYSGNIPPGGANRMRFSDSKFDSLYTNALNEPKDSLRIEAYREMERIMLKEAPVILLYYDRIMRISNPKVSGLRTNPMNMLYLKEVAKAQ